MLNVYLLYLLLGLMHLFCSCISRSADYCHFYSHLSTLKFCKQEMQESDYFLIILVDAHHLDYTNTEKFFHSVAKHPNNHSKEGDVGHAWVYLQGKDENRTIRIEGGHSGERATQMVRYFDGIMNYHEYGYANPLLSLSQSPRYEPNPIKYLWTTRQDGFFQKGSGGHRPTFAAKITLAKEQFYCIKNFIKCYSYCSYALVGAQCSSFVSQIASLAKLDLPSQITMSISPFIYYKGYHLRLWKNSIYSHITFSTPDIIEKNLIRLVHEGKAEYALRWYNCKKNKFSNL